MSTDDRIRVREVKQAVEKANRSEVARVTGISLSHVSRVLDGKRTPSTDKLVQIAEALRLTMVELHTCLMRLRARRASRKRTAA